MPFFFDLNLRCQNPRQVEQAGTGLFHAGAVCGLSPDGMNLYHSSKRNHTSPFALSAMALSCMAISDTRGMAQDLEHDGYGHVSGAFLLSSSSRGGMGYTGHGCMHLPR